MSVTNQGAIQDVSAVIVRTGAAAVIAKTGIVVREAAAMVEIGRDLSPEEGLAGRRLTPKASKGSLPEMPMLVSQH